MFRVSGALSKPAFTAFVITAVTNNLIETPYKVLTASNLSSFKEIDFCVSPPWLGELAFADDGLGGKVLTFTPTPPEKIAFKTANDAYGDTGFTNANWSSGLPPSVGKTYVSRSYEMRLPPKWDITFPGKRLIYDNVMNISLKGTGTATITDLTVMNNASFSMTEPTASRLAGNIRLHPVLDAGRNYALYVNGWSNLRSLYLFANLYGYGDIILSTLGDPSTGVAMHILSGNNTNFFGKIKVQGNTNFWLRVTSEEKIGGVPPAFRADQLSFNGAGLSVTNDVTLDDSTRGITLLADGGTGNTSNDEGAYPTNSLAADRRFEGGVTMRPEVGNTLTVNCPITGPGMLIKEGGGLLLLGGYNSYTGLTAVTSGALRPTTTNAFGTGPVKVHAGGRLVRRYPSATMPKGVELGGAITFEAGSAVRVELEEGQALSANFTLPLFLLPTGETIDPSTVPIEHAFRNYKATVRTSTVDSRVLVSVQLTIYGTRIVVQ
jgi:autotransporter-associated beta strand protein